MAPYPYLGGAGAPAPNGFSNNGPAILSIDWAFFSLSTAVVFLRLFTRIFIVPSFGWDDFFIALAQATNIVGKCLTIEEVANGLGLHEWQITPANYSLYLKYNYLDWCQVFLTLALAKISICLFLLRLSQFEKLRFFLYGLIAFIALTHLPLFFLIAFQCNPVSKNWHPDWEGSCFSRGALEGITNAQGVISIIIDFICVGFPVVLLRRTTIRWKTKLGLSLLMGLGILTAIACIVRVCYSWQIQATDVTWVGIPNALSRIAEVNLGNIAACIPVLKPLVRYCHACITGNDPHNMLHRETTFSKCRSHAFSRSSSTVHGRWYYRYIPTAMTSHKDSSSRSTLPGIVTPSTASSMSEHFRGRGETCSEITKTTFSEAYGPDPTTRHRSMGREAFDFAAPPDSPRSPGQVHERVDKLRGIMVDTDIMVEHIEERR